MIQAFSPTSQLSGELGAPRFRDSLTLQEYLIHWLRICELAKSKSNLTTELPVLYAKRVRELCLLLPCYHVWLFKASGRGSAPRFWRINAVQSMG